MSPTPDAVADVHAPRSGFRDRRDDPGTGRIGGIGLGIAQRVLPRVDDLGLPVAVDVLQKRLFVADDPIGWLHDDERVPAPVLPLRIDVERAHAVARVAAMFRMSGHPSPVKSCASCTIDGIGHSLVGL